MSQGVEKRGVCIRYKPSVSKLHFTIKLQEFRERLLTLMPTHVVPAQNLFIGWIRDLHSLPHSSSFIHFLKVVSNYKFVFQEKRKKEICKVKLIFHFL